MSDELPPLPALRPEIEAVPIRYRGQPIFRLFDRSGLSPAEIGVSPAWMFVIAQLDGATSILDIQDRFARASGGEILPSDAIRQVLSELDRACFLQGEHFEEFLAETKRQFAAADVRAAICAGSAYSDDPDELQKQLQKMIAKAPPPEEAIPARADRAPPAGVIAPHIDYARGGLAYGQIYRELAAREAPARVVIIGTSHVPLRHRFAVCTKDFAVPGGVMKHDVDAVRFILDASAGVADWREDAFAHRGEHSVELQAVWLRHIWGEKVLIIPVLAGSLASPIDQPAAVAEDRQLLAFIQALRRLADEMHGRTLFIASADLAHIGRRFGDDRDIDNAFLSETEEADRHYLAAVASGDAAAGLASLQRHNDRYHVCGSAAIYTLNSVLANVRGRLLGYHQASTPEMQQAVTFAAMIFE